MIAFQSLAKAEALALIGARLFAHGTVRIKNNTHGPSGKHASPVTWATFLLPDLLEDGAPAATDAYGRKHVIPEWYGKSRNDKFVEQLHLRMNLVKVSFEYVSIGFL